MQNIRRRMYQVDQSPLYRIRTKRKLADVLKADLSGIPNYTHDTERHYKVFPIKTGTKSRWIQEPKTNLKRLHTRIFRLLQRIDVPAYLHSGTKGRSYVSNAEAHKGPLQVFKLDIKSFFPSVAPTHIYHFFHDVVQCAPDVAYQLRALCTYGDQLPTGSCISQIVAFYAYKDLFDKLYQLADEHDLTMTCYVDDLTFSGAVVPGQFRHKTKQAIKLAGLSSHKEMFYGQTKKKLVTGVVIDGDRLRVSNKQRLSIYQTLKLFHGLPPGEERDKALRSLVGRCCAASLVESRYKRVGQNVLRKDRELKRTKIRTVPAYPSGSEAKP